MSSVSELRSNTLSIEWLPGKRVRIVSNPAGHERRIALRCVVSAVIAGLTVPVAQSIESAPLSAGAAAAASLTLAAFVFFVKYVGRERGREILLDWESRKMAITTRMRVGRRVKRARFDDVREVLLRSELRRRGDARYYSCSLRLRLRSGWHELVTTRAYLTPEAARAAALPAARELSTALPAPLREVTEVDARPEPLDLPVPPPEDCLLSGKAISRLSPALPRAAPARDGSVTVQVMVSERGRVTEAVALSGDPALHDVALSAAREWVFVPMRVSGTPVKVRGRITIDFEPAPEASVA
jgi:TonB family protein